MNARFQTTLETIKQKAQSMTADEIQAEIDSLMAEADALCKKIVHDPKMQDTRDRVLASTVEDYTMIATAWSMI